MQLKFPVWLSGEILPGPNNIDSPLDANLFLRLCSTTFPHSTLVLGWRTGPYLTDHPNVYSWAMVKEMYNMLVKWKIRQPVVFSVKGPFARRSVLQLKWLMEMTDAALVVYNEQKDGMAAVDIMAIKQRLPQTHMFIDLDDDLQGHVDSLKMSQLPMQHNIRANNSFQPEKWTIVHKGTQLHFGTEAALFQQAVFLSHESYHPTSSLATVIEAVLEFVPPYLDSDLRQPQVMDDQDEEELGLEIFLRVTKSARHSSISGVRCFIGSEGSLSISAQGMPGTDSLAELKWQEMPVCVKVIITDLGSDSIAMEVFKLEDCYTDNSKVVIRKYLTLDSRSLSISDGKIAVRGKGKTGYIAIMSFQVMHVSTKES